MPFHDREHFRPRNTPSALSAPLLSRIPAFASLPADATTIEVSDALTDLLAEVLDLVMDTAFDPRSRHAVLFGAALLPGLPGSPPASDASIEVFFKPLLDEDPVESIDSIDPPAYCLGLGLIAASTARIADEEHDITLAVMVDARGTVSSRLLAPNSGNPWGGDFHSGEGRVVDALRRAVRAAPPQVA